MQLHLNINYQFSKLCRFVFILLIIGIPKTILAQEVQIVISSRVVDESDNGISGALVSTGKDAVFTDEDGSFSIETNVNSALLISAPGFREFNLYVGEDYAKGSTIVLKRDIAFTQEDEAVHVPFGKVNKQQAIGAISEVKGEELLRYPDLSLLNALAGRVSGLYSLQKSSTPGWNAPSMVVRGLSGTGNNAPLIYVDGIERSANELLPEEIESVQVLKDISAKILYGSRAADGVILVTTKRGLPRRKLISVDTEFGVMLPTSDPEWLDATAYATLYNEARANDGLPAYYSQAEIDAYRTGSDYVMYPNNDFHKQFLNSNMPMSRAVAQFQGGSKKSAYYVNLGYTGTGGYENIAEPTSYNKMNIRSNLDVKLTSVTKLRLDIAGRMEFRRSANMTTMDFFKALSTHRPNEYPIMFSDGSEPELIYLGGSYEHPNNIYGMGNLTKYKKQLDRNIQFNIGFDFDFNKYINGVTASASFSYDNLSMYRHGIVEQPETYKVLSAIDNGDGTVDYEKVKLQLEKLKYGNTQKLADDYIQKIGFIGQVNYNRTFAEKHALKANFVWLINSSQYLGNVQRDKQLNYGLRVNYAFSSKYIAELDLSYMGSSHFAPGKQFGLFPALGLGWVVSEERWLENVEAIDFLKLKVTGGEMGYDKGAGYYLYEDRWKTGRTVSFSDRNKTKVRTTNFIKLGNPDLTWEKAREINIGVESILFNRKLSVEANYFNEDRYDIMTTLGTQYPEYFGANLPTENYGEVKNSGFDGDFIFHKYKGTFTFNIGVNFVYSKSEVIKANELMYPSELDYMSTINQSSDVFTGYVADGLLTDADLITYRSTLGAVMAGDVKYKDLNNDGVIDNRDRTVIGNDFPTFTSGIHFDLKYKGFELYALGVVYTGFDTMKSNLYFWVNGAGKYSGVVNDRWTPATSATASYPRLTTTSGSNNFVNSTYWMEDADFFKLKNVELSYSLSDRLLASTFMNRVRFYIRGTNLLSISKFDKLDPENIDAGINDYPLMKSITGGISINF